MKETERYWKLLKFSDSSRMLLNHTESHLKSQKCIKCAWQYLEGTGSIWMLLIAQECFWRVLTALGRHWKLQVYWMLLRVPRRHCKHLNAWCSWRVQTAPGRHWVADCLWYLQDNAEWHWNAHKVAEWSWILLKESEMSWKLIIVTNCSRRFRNASGRRWKTLKDFER